MVIWIIGLSGAGKTTLAEEIYKISKPINPNTVLIDGDVIREIFGNDLGHSAEDRKKNAKRISRLCYFLSLHNINVICSILSLFQTSRDWNRKNIKDYFEVYIKTPISNLIERDPKGIYKRYNDGMISNVAGLDLTFEEPLDPDLIINNNEGVEDLLKHSLFIADILKE